MAKKKDITRNPPSWIEKGLFIGLIVAVLAIAFPVFWSLNETTRELYACEAVQKELREIVEKWRTEEKGGDIYAKITRKELEELWGGPIPDCAYPPKRADGGRSDTCNLFYDTFGTIRCIYHVYDPSIGAKPTATPEQ